MPDIKPEPTVETASDELPDTQDTLPDAETNSSAAAPRKKTRLGPWLFLLLIFIALPAAWLLSPPQIRQQAQQLIMGLLPQAQHASEVEPTPAVAPPSAQTTDTSPETNAPEPMQAEAPSTPQDTTPAPASDTVAEEPADVATVPSEATNAASAPAVAAPSPEQTKALLDEMHRLQDELAAVQTGQRELQQQLQARQKLELRMRLRWLSRSGTSLEQYAALWNEVAVLPDIDETQRSLAEQMAGMAQDDLMHIEAWRKSLLHLAAQLPEKQQADILPKTENRYFAWLLDAFHLRPAAGEADRKRTDLQRQVLNMAQALDNEVWPEPRDWRHLLGALHDQFGDDTDLGLPESLQDVQQHMADMRDKATGWLGSL